MSARRMLQLVGLAASTAALAACGSGGPSFGTPTPADTQGQHISNLLRGMELAALVVGVIVWGLISWSIIRYRRSRYDDDIGSQRSYNIPLEIAYTAIPIVIVAVLFACSLHTERQVVKLDPHPDVRIEVIGFQWQWQFRYLGEGFVVTGASVGEPPEMVIPVGETIQLQLVTRDVNHSFWVPRFLSKRDLIPGVHNVIDVDPTTIATYDGRCASFCGLDHWRMNFTVRAVSPADYQRWLAKEKAGSG